MRAKITADHLERTAIVVEHRRASIVRRTGKLVEQGNREFRRSRVGRNSREQVVALLLDEFHARRRESERETFHLDVYNPCRAASRLLSFAQPRTSGTRPLTLRERALD